MDLWHDVLSAIQFLHSVLSPAKPLILIGYSFGCSLLPLVCSKVCPAALVLIAPPLDKHDYSGYATLRKPILAIFSSDDFTSESTMAHRWFERISAPKQMIQEKRDNHFFRGHEAWLAEEVSGFLQEHV
jgi:alpha/beta superfamily hydrolase